VAVALAMTGWPIGWLVGPPRLAEAVTIFQENTTSHPDNIAQAAALAALEIGLDLDAVNAALDRRRMRLLASLTELPGVAVVEPRGGLHAFPSVEGCLGGRLRDRVISTALELSADLLDHAGVAVAPGEAFGGFGHLRVSFSVPDHELDQGLGRLVGYLTEVRGAASATRPVSMSVSTSTVENAPYPVSQSDPVE
jgi:aspartate/methionine/tyrosine aminotransferase